MENPLALHRVVLEMTGPIPYELTLGEIIRDGDVTNTYQAYVLSLLSRAFQAGVPPETLGGSAPLEGSTSVAAAQSVRAMSPADRVTLARYLLGAVRASAAAEPAGMPLADWLAFVRQRME